MNSKTRRRRFRALIRRDGAACAYCGRPAGTGEPFSRLSVDHVIPVSRGGTDALTNLVLACRACNCAKGARLWEVGVSARAAV
jgi:5-methylcytosine-specific restriction endonuclease McrA